MASNYGKEKIRRRRGKDSNGTFAMKEEEQQRGTDYRTFLPVLVFPVKLTKQSCIPDKILFLSQVMLIFGRSDGTDFGVDTVNGSGRKKRRKGETRKKQNQWLVLFS